MEMSNGNVQWKCAVEKCNETCAMEMCNGNGQWGMCNGNVQWETAVAVFQKTAAAVLLGNVNTPDKLHMWESAMEMCRGKLQLLFSIAHLDPFESA